MSSRTVFAPTLGSLNNVAPNGTSVELFAGGGGLALGVERATYRHLVVNEFDGRACETLRANGAFDFGEKGHGWPLISGDCRDVDWREWRGQVDLLAGGPPCQPFSLGGIHRGDEDTRNLFPEAIRALHEIRPRAFLFENVRGLVRRSFRPYFDYITRRLAAPHLAARDDESWLEHDGRLERELDTVPDTERYTVRWTLLNAADYGVPQQRWRVLIAGYRADLDLEPEFPTPTHSRDALLASQLDGSYWREHNIKPRDPQLTPAARKRIERAGTSGARWRTVRDALRGLPEPKDGVETPNVFNHVGIPGARLYKGHSGSPIDWPAKSVKAGVHGCPGGEHILLREDQTYRYFTVRECARLQGFPDTWRFEGPRSEAMRQIGNAVPVDLAETLAVAVRAKLSTDQRLHAVA
jgi:DNA (cytosine-5)-methyltransferase 1